MNTRLRQIQPVLMAHDVASSILFYEQLGFKVSFRDDTDSPRYAAMRRDGLELHLQWADATQWQPNVDRPAVRFVVDDVDALYAEFVARSARVASPQESPWCRPANTPWGTREFHLRDPGGSSLQFYQAI
ncbi:MAG: VOC family protein [Betaproteobacteria bacterium]|nr:VOC family protein [Betaproteobacteria bacterium]